MNDNQTEHQRPWYVRYHIVPDPKKPRTAVMSMVHGYVYFWVGLWTLFFLIVGLALVFSVKSLGSVILGFICLAAAYGGYWYIRRERARDRERRTNRTKAN